jgi:putative flippase GtrA
MNPADASPTIPRTTRAGLREKLLLFRQPLVFLAVGVSATLAYTLLSTWLVAGAGWRPVPAGALSYLLMIPPTYLAQKNLTFGVGADGEARFLRYAALQSIGLLTSTAANGGFAVATTTFHGVYFFASAMAASALNYLIMRFGVFSGAPALARPGCDQG